LSRGNPLGQMVYHTPSDRPWLYTLNQQRRNDLLTNVAFTLMVEDLVRDMSS
jgi:hypothetical protein